MKKTESESKNITNEEKQELEDFIEKLQQAVFDKLQNSKPTRNFKDPFVAILEMVYPECKERK